MSELPEAGTGRTEAFSDGVLAVAITLLVFDLVTPMYSRGHLDHALLSLWPSYIAFLSSFVIVGVIWVNHHAIFRQIRTVDAALNWANMALLLGAVVVPFPTKVLADALRSGDLADERAAIALYSVVTTYIAASWYVFYVVLYRQYHLADQSVERRQLRRQRVRSLIGIAAYLLATAVGFAVPLAGLATYGIMALFYAITSEGLRGPPSERSAS